MNGQNCAIMFFYILGRYLVRVNHFQNSFELRLVV